MARFKTELGNRGFSKTVIFEADGVIGAKRLAHEQLDLLLIRKGGHPKSEPYEVKWIAKEEPDGKWWTVWLPY